jgi:hypothetical protein
MLGSGSAILEGEIFNKVGQVHLMVATQRGIVVVLFMSSYSTSQKKHNAY